ncbi:MAG TPA: hypothetical protein VNA68_00690 [Candidatus Dormibacteraeota bacterium]|nr:hypothetical protein [Candidatus Dormibacteraeota bacterium]
MSDCIAEEAAVLAEKEQWVQNAARIISDCIDNIDMEVAVSSARWASLWLDDVKLYEPLEDRDRAIEVIKSAFSSSLERAEGVERYPTGVPSIRSMIAAKEAFCLAYGNEAQGMKKLLDEVFAA